VTTGQQTGLFTGPLYTVYKALTAISLAGALQRLLDRPVLALFWSAADDHDWDEVSHVTVLDGEGYPHRIGLGGRGTEPPHPMSHRRLDDSALRALDELRELLPPTSHRDELLPRLRAAYSPGRSMAAAFEDALATVLAGQEIALVSSADPLVKQHALPVVAAALEQAGRDEEQVSRQTERLVRAGYHAQVAVAAGASNVFFADEQGRDRLVREGTRWALRRTRRVLSSAELKSRLEAEPAAFSPNVLLRPVVESALFPTLAYVGGPAECSYFGQIGCLFQAHGIMPPVVFPRPRITLVEEPVTRALDRFGLDLARLQQPTEQLLDAAVHRELPAEVHAELERLRRAIGERYQALAAAAEPAAPGVGSPLAGARRQALAQAAAMEKKIVQHARREQSTRLEQLRRAAALVQPGGAPQERTLNVFPFLGRYGPELLARILASLPVGLGASHPGFAGVGCGGEPLAARSADGIAW
jgi:bacillithiol biosynthesis cysteine-adding enzyme BshC